MTTEPSVQPIVIQIDPHGRLTLSKQLLSSAGLHEGDHVLVLPLEAGLLYLRRLEMPDPVSREELGTMMRAAFVRTGCTSREEVLERVRAARFDTELS